MANHNQKIGRWGEEVASVYLQKKGYKFVDMNVRTPHGEIDIILQDDKITVFVEVKTRTSTQYGPPEMAITRQKQLNMFNSAEYYAEEHKIIHWQIDAISVEGNPNSREPKITHFEDVI
ncbi:MAG: YraN family protein [Anaerolineae bacterium]|jgi:putative endonuclease|nr:YraN family protein [Anaerolineae bacterium]MBT7075754.1 YraN family protein [Anaerolineae bacterium]MBT7781779.1 YraN family protein [Anaerolineae bacterium]